MKILNWNFSLLNPKVEEAIHFIKETNSDVISLQEFPHKYLPHLEIFKKYNYQKIADSTTRNKNLNTYLIILSKYEIISSGTYDYFDTQISSLYCIWDKKNALLVYMLKSRLTTSQ